MKRVLIVEDELASRRGLNTLLRELDPRIEVVGAAADGKQGLAQLSALTPDVALVDVCMPEMDGLEMIREAKRQGIATQFILVTAYAEFDYARKAVALGVKDYLLKPVTAEDLADVLKRVLPEMQQPRNHTAHHPMVERTLKMIRDEYASSINLTSISDKLQISTEYISYLFHRDMGINFSTYLRQFRIDRAYEMMHAGSTRIYEIAHACGFSDAKYFCRVFREVTGKSPGVYLRETAAGREADEDDME